jgi:hypothetical protein
MDQGGCPYPVHLDDDTPGGESWAINNEHGIWRVYYFERGIRSGEHDFASEADACNWLWTHFQTSRAEWPRFSSRKP